MFELQEVRNDVRAMLRDDARLITQTELDRAIGLSLRQLNHDRPFIVVKDIPGDGGQDYALPSEFLKGFSDVEQVEAPAGDIRPIIRDRIDDWFLYEDPTKALDKQQRLRFRGLTPAASATLSNLDVDEIIFQSGNTIRYTFNGSPDLSSVLIGQALSVTTANNTANNGSFFISVVNDGSDFVEITNPDRTDNTDDEASDSPAIAEAQIVDIIRVTIRTINTVSITSSTLDPNSFQAVIYKALVFLFRSLAARFTESSEPTILADSIDLGGRAQGYLFLSERYETSYKQITGIGKDVKAAQAMVETDLIFSHGEDLLWHPARTR